MLKLEGFYQILLFIAVSVAVQILLYWICAKRKLKWFDFVLFAFLLFAHAWLFPKILLSQPDQMGCAFSTSAMDHLSLLFFGLAGTIIAFIVNGSLWKWRYES